MKIVVIYVKITRSELLDLNTYSSKKIFFEREFFKHLKHQVI